MLQQLRIGLRSGIGVHLESSFSDTRVGRLTLPTLPKLKKRNCWTVRTPAEIHDILVGRTIKFPKSALMDDMLRALTGYSIFISNGDAWKRHRRLMDPAFETARIRDVFPMMLEATNACVARLEVLAGRPDAATRPVAIDVEMTHFAADIIFRTIYSEPMDGADARRFFKAFEVFQSIAYAHGMLKLTKFPTWVLPGHWRAKRSAKIIREILRKPLDRRLGAIRAGEAVPHKDILATLLRTVDPETGTGFDDAELLDQIAMLFLAGHETSATAAAWALYLLAQCPHIQQRAHEQAVTVYGRRAPEFSDMKKLTRTRDVFREALRLYPPVAVLARDAKKKEKILNRTVKKGDVLFVAPWLMQRHAAYWENPHAFDPDRFDTPSGRESLRCAYFPFSMGPRVCAGASFALQESTLVLSELVRRFRFSPVDGHTPDPVARLTLRSANGIPLIVTRR